MNLREMRKSSNVKVSPAESLGEPDEASAPPKRASRGGWSRLAVSLILALAVWAVFGQTLRHDFVYDDLVSVYENPLVTQGVSLQGTIQLFSHIDPVTHDWWPLNELSHAIDWQLYGANPSGHHLSNLLLHAATSILLFLMLLDMTGAFWRSAFVAAVFAIHPLRVESVAWVTERKDVLSGMFFMLTLWAYARHARRANDSNFRLRFSPPYVLALAFFGLGLMSKSILVTTPFILMLLDYWPLRRFPAVSSPGKIAPLIGEKIPFLLLAAASGIVTMVAQKQTTLQAVQSLALPWRISNALVSYAVYLLQMIWPVGLAPLYPHPGDRLSLGLIGISVASIGMVSLAVAKAQAKRPYLLVGWLWYLLILLPVIGILPVAGGQAAHADRYTYLPQIGLDILIAWGAVDLSRRWRWHPAVLGTGAASALVGLMALAHIQTKYWKTEISLWRHTLACTKENWVANNNLGNALADKGRFEEAVEHYQEALRIVPLYAEAHYNLGDALAAQGNLEGAIQSYREALRIKPDYAKAHNNLGQTLLQEGKADIAIDHFQKAIAIDPQYEPPYNNLAWVLATNPSQSVRNGAKALELAQQADRLAGGKDPSILDTLAAAFAEQGRFSESMETMLRAIDLAKAKGHSDLVPIFESHLKLYLANQPLRENR